MPAIQVAQLSHGQICQKMDSKFRSRKLNSIQFVSKIPIENRTGSPLVSSWKTGELELFLIRLDSIKFSDIIHNPRPRHTPPNSGNCHRPHGEGQASETLYEALPKAESTNPAGSSHGYPVPPAPLPDPPPGMHQTHTRPATSEPDPAQCPQIRLFDSHEWGQLRQDV